MNATSGVGTGVDQETDPRLALSAELREALDRELDPGERLRWCGQPDPRRVWIGVLPLFALGGGFAAIVGGMIAFASISTFLAELSASRAGGPGPSRTSLLGLLPAVLLFVGAAWFWRQPWVVKAQARRTVFALTSTRVFTLLARADGRADLTAFEPGHPLGISRTEYKDGTSTISLNPGAQAPGMPRTHQASFEFVGVRDARLVERLIRQTFDPPAAK